MFTAHSRWVQRLTRPDLSRLEVIVYSRAQCCCCHKALELLREYQAQYHFVLKAVDIDKVPALLERYNHDVPVVSVGGKVRFKGVVNPALLDRLLLAEGRGGSQD